MRILKIMLIGLIGTQVWAGGYKVSPELGLLIFKPERAADLQGPALKKSTDGWRVDTIVRFNGPVSDLYNLGTVRCIQGNIAVMSIPVSALGALATSPVVQYAEISRTDHPLLNVSTDSIRVPEARAQFGYTGKGVVIGIIDSGIDWTHEDFIKSNGTTRIKYLLDLSYPGNLYGGRLYTEQDINFALNHLSGVNERDYSGHGTHVAGIAAGDGSTTAQFGKYAGVAPDADLVVVKATRDAQSSEFQTADQIIALHVIDSLATALNEPYVVNMSLGGNWGAHNGTSPVEQVIDGMTGPGIGGKAIVTVAGNDGDVNLHAQANFTDATGSKEITLEIDPYYPTAGSNNDYVALDLWYNSNQNVSLTITSPSGYLVGPITQGEWKEETLQDGTVYAWNGFYDNGDDYYSGLDPIIGAYEMYVELRDEQSGTPPKDGTWTFRFSGSQGNVDAWIAAISNYNMNPRFVDGAIENGKVSTPGTANNCITVGAYVSKKNWTDLDGNSLTFDNVGEIRYGDIADFSSPGPTRDNRVKPEITAPGQIIESSYSKDAPSTSTVSIFYSGSHDFPNGYISETGRQALSSGTSMAGPHVAGAVALIFEQYHDSTAYPSAIQVRNMLTQSAHVGKFVGSVPNDTWGYGMLDVQAALKQSIREEETLPFQLLNIYPNPFNYFPPAYIQFELPIKDRMQNVTVAIYNALGQRVRFLFSKRLNSGLILSWDGRDDLGYKVAKGVYFVEVNVDNVRYYKKLLLWDYYITGGN